jgi:hypothetical protein
MLFGSSTKHNLRLEVRRPCHAMVGSGQGQRCGARAMAGRGGHVCSARGVRSLLDLEQRTRGLLDLERHTCFNGGREATSSWHTHAPVADVRRPPPISGGMRRAGIYEHRRAPTTVLRQPLNGQKATDYSVLEKEAHGSGGAR